ncbi:MAG TPA: hypothetical protein VF120_12665 [Ktedonobacterales bacterium]
MIGQALVQFLTMVQQLLSDYVSRAETNGRQSAEIERYKRLQAEFACIVTSLLHGPDGKLPKDALTALARAFEIVEMIVERPVDLLRAQVGDHLYEMSLRPEYAAIPGSILYNAAAHLRATAANQFAWSNERFRRPFLTALLHRPYRHVGPADIEIQFVALLAAAREMSRAAESALRRLDLATHPATLLLPKQAQPDAPSPAISSEGSSSALIKLSAPHDVMERLRSKLVVSASLLGDQSRVTVEELAKATVPGGGVDPRIVRENGLKLLRACAIGIAHIENGRKYIADLNNNTVDAA